MTDEIINYKGRGKGMAWLRANVGHQGDECLTYPLSCDDKGYGSVSYGYKITKASRAMCVLAHGRPPTPKHQAAHSCGNGNKGCVNPRHLSWKTNSENQRDSIQHGTFGRKKGQSRWKLEPSDVIRIKSLRGKASNREIAAQYGVAPETIAKIFRGNTWKTNEYHCGGRWKPGIGKPVKSADR